MSWVMKSAVLCVAFQIRRSSSCIISRVCASSAAKGSSRRSISGSVSRARAGAEGGGVRVGVQQGGGGGGGGGGREARFSTPRPAGGGLGGGPRPGGGVVPWAPPQKAGGGGVPMAIATKTAAPADLREWL